MLKDISMKCIWCKHNFTEEQAWLILSEDTCVCEDCSQEWADNLLYNYISLCEEIQKYIKRPTQKKLENILYKIKENEHEI